jgi:hypothetical protein
MCNEMHTSSIGLHCQTTAAILGLALELAEFAHEIPSNVYRHCPPCLQPLGLY